jgi:hypothetical protein
LFNRKFVPMFRESGQATILELHKLNIHNEIN